ncbi:BnaC05g15560D [Brassica napus]|uniref:BnaC05g15560D protein n=1 Tax=Brassica napus TaxID=3708 RepID=A0A078I3S4_BRANA|nr:BnaC05g15560D [Brassica napus]
MAEWSKAPDSNQISSPEYSTMLHIPAKKNLINFPLQHNNKTKSSYEEKKKKKETRGTSFRPAILLMKTRWPFKG